MSRKPLAPARDPANRTVAISVIRQAGKIEGLFSIAGAIGTVIGLVLLSIGLFRGRIGPRWVSPLLWVFLILQFAGSSVSAYASLTSVTVALIAYWALAVTVSRPPATTWQSAEVQVTPQPAAYAIPT